MKVYEVAIKEIKYGWARVKAKDTESASIKAQDKKNWIDSGFGDEEIEWESVYSVEKNGDIGKELK